MRWTTTTQHSKTTSDSVATFRESSIPVRLLGLAMPLVIIIGLAFAGVMFGILSFWEAALVGGVTALAGFMGVAFLLKAPELGDITRGRQ